MNEKYKSLIYREWKLVKRFYIVRVLVLLFFALMMGGASLYALSEPMDPPEAAMLFKLIFLYWPIFCDAALVGEDNGIYKSDVANGWLRFSWALPLTAYEMVVPRYIMKGMAILLGMIIAFVTTMVFCGVTDFTYFATALYAFFWVVNIALMRDLIINIFIMFSIKMENMKKAINVGMGTLSIGALLVIVYYTSKAASSQINGLVQAQEIRQEIEGLLYIKLVDILTIPHFWGMIGILLTFVLFLAGFLVTLKNYERRRA